MASKDVNRFAAALADFSLNEGKRRAQLSVTNTIDAIERERMAFVVNRSEKPSTLAGVNAVANEIDLARAVSFAKAYDLVGVQAAAVAGPGAWRLSSAQQAARCPVCGGLTKGGAPCSALCQEHLAMAKVRSDEAMRAASLVDSVTLRRRTCLKCGIETSPKNAAGFCSAGCFKAHFDLKVPESPKPKPLQRLCPVCSGPVAHSHPTHACSLLCESKRAAEAKRVGDSAPSNKASRPCPVCGGPSVDGASPCSLGCTKARAAEAMLADADGWCAFCWVGLLKGTEFAARGYCPSPSCEAAGVDAEMISLAAPGDVAAHVRARFNPIALDQMGANSFEVTARFMVAAENERE